MTPSSVPVPLPRVAPRLDWWGMVWTLVRTDFKVRYHGTLMGFLWALLKPFTMFVVLMAVFSLIFASDPDYKLDLIIGLFLWDFFAESTKVGLISLAAKSFLLGKTRFPGWIVVVTSGSNALLTLAVVAVATIVSLPILGAHVPGPVDLALFALYLVQLALICTGIGLGASVLFLRYRDLNQVWDVVTHAGFFVAPVIYPLHIIPERFHFYLYLWPPTPVIQFSRSVLVDGVVPSLRAHLMLAGMTLAVLATGVTIFRAHARRIAEHL